MRKLTTLFMSLALLSGMTACSSQPTQNGGASDSPSLHTDSPSPLTDSTSLPESAEISNSPSSESGKILVVYYSATGRTEEAASIAAAATGADVFKLEPSDPYTDKDLNYSDDGSRVVYEHDNPDARTVELMAATINNWEEYETVLIGYPIWWGIAAWPVDSFIWANDFTGKTVVPFCTSESSGLGSSRELLEEMAGTGNWVDGERFASNVSEETVKTWAASIIKK